MNWNVAIFSAYPYPISAKSHVWQEVPDLGPEAGREFGKLFLQVFEKNKEPEREIRQCLARWPESAYFKFLLAECLHRRNPGEGQRALEMLVADHPDHLLALAIQLRWFVTQDAPPPAFYESSPLVELNAYFPGRQTFHPFEVYFWEHNLHLAAIKSHRFDQASHPLIRYPNLVQGDLQLFMWENDSPDAFFDSQIPVYDDEDDDEGFDDEDDDDYFDEYDDDDFDDDRAEYDLPRIARAERLRAALNARQTQTPPQFTLRLTESLYNAPMFLSESDIEAFTSADRAILLADLRRILVDAVDRYAYFEATQEENNAVLHAIVLACHFQDMEALPPLMDFLGQLEEVSEYWLGDITLQNVPQWLAPLLRHNLRALDPLVLDPDAYDYGRVCAIAAIEQYVMHWPDDRETVETHMLDLVAQITAPGREDLDEDTVLGYIANLAVSTKMPRLLQALKPLYEADRVDTIFVGDWTETLESFNQPILEREKHPLHLDSLQDKYVVGLNWTNQI